MATAQKAITYPNCVLISGRMGLDAVAGLAYVRDVNGVFTVAGASDRMYFYPYLNLAKNGEVCSMIFIGAPMATLGVGGATVGQPLCMGAGGKLIVGTVGTDHITCYATQTGVADANISVAKFA